ncbi:MAG: thiamine-binding protein [bacterium]|nr:thiamine-binding protein [bacterium]MCY3926465.1 thiamine-binding protein [bacterium]
MGIVHIEFFVEPFKEGAPGPHVAAAVAAFADAGLEPEVGPFATTAAGDIDQAATATAAMVSAALQAGATRIVLRLERDPRDPAAGEADGT